MDQAQFNNLLTQLGALITAIQGQQPANGEQRELNIVKIQPFSGESDDPISWIEDFEAAANANGWSTARRLQVVPAYLKDAAAQWLQEQKSDDATRPTHWQTTDDHTDKKTTFRQPFINHFRTTAKLDVWQNELDAHTQEPSDTVEKYATKLRELH